MGACIDQPEGSSQTCKAAHNRAEISMIETLQRSSSIKHTRLFVNQVPPPLSGLGMEKWIVGTPLVSREGICKCCLDTVHVAE